MGKTRVAASCRVLLRIRIAIHCRKVQREAHRGLPEHEPRRLERGLGHYRAHALGVRYLAMQHHLVVQIEHQFRARAVEPLPERRDQGQCPLCGAALDDEVAGEPSPVVPNLVGSRLALRAADQPAPAGGWRRAGAAEPGVYDAALYAGLRGVVDEADGSGEAAAQGGQQGPTSPLVWPYIAPRRPSFAFERSPPKTSPSSV